MEVDERKEIEGKKKTKGSEQASMKHEGRGVGGTKGRKERIQKGKKKKKIGETR